MTVCMVRSTVKPECVAEVEAAIERMFTAINEAKPAGVRYASTKLDDGVTFVVLLELEGAENPLVAVPAFTEFQGDLKNWIAAPPTMEQMSVVGSYRLF